MMNEYEDKTPGCSCSVGCLSLIIWILLFTFCIDILVKSCERDSIVEGAVLTTKDYCNTIDSVWNLEE